MEDQKSQLQKQADQLLKLGVEIDELKAKANKTKVASRAELVNQPNDLIEKETGTVTKDPLFKAVQIAMVQGVFKKMVAHKPLDQDVVVNQLFGWTQGLVVQIFDQ